jgi:hypothetical protein
MTRSNRVPGARTVKIGPKIQQLRVIAHETAKTSENNEFSRLAQILY